MSRSSVRILVSILVLAGLVSPGVAATIELAAEHPVAGTPTLVSLRDVENPETLTLRVTYRPGSETAETEAVGPFSSEGTVAWSPRVAGLSTLSARGDAGEVASRSVAVRFDRIPPLGVVIFVGAGLLLFGGATVMLRRALDA